MTSREFIKILAALTISFLLHVVVLAGIPYRLSHEIKFKKKKTEIRLNTYRPFVPARRTNDSPDPVVGLSSEKNRVTKGETPGEVLSPPAPRYEENAEEVPPSILTEFIAKMQSKEVQDGMERVRKEKKRTWEGKEIHIKEPVIVPQEKILSKEDQRKYLDTYLDPRVKIVVVSYPPTAIETHHPTIFYPDLRVKKRELQSGWCNIAVSIFTDGDGKVIRQNIIRPVGKELSPREELFLEHTIEELKDWSFDAVSSEIIIDVRYFVE